MTKTACVILAAGLGKRMRSSLPKVLHPVMGAPMIRHVLDTAKGLDPRKIIVVAGKHFDRIRQDIGDDGVSFALQKEPKGTGHALSCARPLLKGFRGTVVVLNGDTPLVTSATIRKLLRHHDRNGDRLSVLSFRAADPAGYGRIVRDGNGSFLSITEEKDADPAQKGIDEVNSGVYALDHRALDLLDEIRMNRLKGEYYLTDIVGAALRKGLRTSAYCMGSEEEFMGVNTREELITAAALMRNSVIRRLTAKGVNFLDPAAVYIEPWTSVGRDTTIHRNVCIEGRTKVGKRTVIYPNVRISDSTLGDGVVIKDSTVIESSEIRAGATVGPFAHVRPGSVIGPRARIGNFVELKKTAIGRGSKASHLSYLGDATIGSDVNIGAGTITCNYDGKDKHLTVIEDGVFVGSDTQFVAPVRVGKGAFIGAGSTITRDVPEEALALSRTEQKNINGWAAKRRSQKGRGGKKR